MKARIQRIIKAAAVTAAAILIMIYPREAADSTVNSINVCLSSVIPSMFAFMVITSYIQSSGLYSIIFRPVMPLMRKLIKADEGIVSVFLLSLFGGYPIGVKLLKEMIAQNKNFPAIVATCSSAASFCYCISPSFALIMIGNGVFGSIQAGAVIYLSNAAACMITAAVVSRTCSLRTGDATDKGNGDLIGAVNSASRALFTVCTVILAFNVALACINALLEGAGIELPVLVNGTLEISNLLGIKHPDVSVIPVVSAISSMGGVCVLMQCGAIVKGSFPVGRFLVARLPCAVLSALISMLILQFTDISVSASTVSPVYTYEFSANKIIVLILIAMCIIIFNRSDKIFKKV